VKPSSKSASPQDQRLAAAKRRPHLAAGVAAVSVPALVALIASVALATDTATTVKSASNTSLGETVVVNVQGLTLYALSPETTHHLLCKSSECFKRWPPLTVRSNKTKLKAGPGIHGSLGILRRSNGKFQVTLRGKPLYRYAEDHAKGDANGQGIESFGGTWHAVTAASSSTKAAPSPPAAPEPSYPSYSY
jgi:predicted lipoprotein with Yx(FWY)xxD motif